MGNRRSALLLVVTVGSLVCLLRQVGRLKEDTLTRTLPTNINGSINRYPAAFGEGVVSKSLTTSVHGTIGRPPDRNLQNENKTLFCQWTVISGDSNNRNAYLKWIELEQFHQKCTVLLGHRVQPQEESCDSWWADHETMILQDDTCHIVTFKFLTNQDQDVRRFRSNLTEFSNNPRCPFPLTITPTSTAFQRPSVPTAIWFSHGLWGLDAPLNPKNDTSCSERFDLHIQALKFYVAQQVPRIAWQTLFPINHHSTITNERIQWDYECQLEQARAQGLPAGMVHDLYRQVAPRREHLIHYKHYHLRDDEFLLRQYLEFCCGGWDSYWKKEDGYS